MPYSKFLIYSKDESIDLNNLLSSLQEHNSFLNMNIDYLNKVSIIDDVTEMERRLFVSRPKQDGIQLRKDQKFIVLLSDRDLSDSLVLPKQLKDQLVVLDSDKVLEIAQKQRFNDLFVKVPDMVLEVEKEQSTKKETIEESNILDDQLIFTVNKGLITKETEHSYFTRIPRTKGTLYMYLPKSKTRWSKDNVTLFVRMDKKEYYKIYDKEGNVTDRWKPEELLSHWEDKSKEKSEGKNRTAEKEKQEPEEIKDTTDKEKALDELNTEKAPEEKKDIHKQKTVNRKAQLTKLKDAINTQISIVEMAGILGFSTAKHGRGTLKLEEHDSCVLWPEKNHFVHYSSIESNGKATGGRPLDMYMHFSGKSYTEAIQDLQSYVDPNKEIVIPVERPGKKQMTEKERQDNLLKQLKENRDKSVKNKEMKNVFAYLTKTRGIDSEIVSKFAKEKLLFQTSDDLGRTQVAFVGKNENGYISAISFRATNPKVKFMGDYSGCDYTRGWFYDPSCDIGQRLFDKSIAPDPTKTLLCFESSIEMMSYMSILKKSGINYHDYAYLSCGSIHKNDAILKTCEAYGFEKAVIMFNNDFVQEQSEGRNPGKEAAIATAEMLNKKGINASVRIPDKVNDWNDYLRDMQREKVSDLVKKTPIAAHSL